MGSAFQSFVTFIVPTIGRPTLQRALGSILDQTDGDWEAVVIYDGVTVDPLPADDHRIWYLEADKGSAGMTRNVGLDWFHSNGGSEWIAFLDDDDVVLPTYVKHLKEHADDHPWADVVVFRMDHPTLGVLPRAGGHLALGSVGISFAVRSGTMQNHKFVAEEIRRGYHEDWAMISEFIAAGEKIFVSPHTEYIVRNHKTHV